MKIGLLADLYLPHVSGVTRHLELCLRRFERLGHEATLYTFGVPLPSDGERVIRSSTLPFGLPYGDHRLKIAWKHGSRAWKRMQESDLLHLHHPLGASARVLKIAGRLHIPSLVTLHTRYDLHLSAYLPSFLMPLARRWMCRKLRSIMGACQKVIVPSREAAIRARALWGAPRSLAVIPNGIDLETLRRAPRAKRPEYGFSEQEPLFLHVGRLAPEKNLKELLRAFWRVHERTRGRACLLIVGDGPSRRRIERRVRSLENPGVTLVGCQPFERVAELYQMADAFVTASRSEVQPLSIMEAMAVGLPVIGYGVPGIRDLVTHRGDGLLAEPDPHSLAAAMLSLLGDRELRQRLSHAARQRGSQFCSLRMTRNLLACYESTLARAVREHGRRSLVRGRRQPL